MNYKIISTSSRFELQAFFGELSKGVGEITDTGFKETIQGLSTVEVLQELESDFSKIDREELMTFLDSIIESSEAVLERQLDEPTEALVEEFLDIFESIKSEVEKHDDSYLAYAAQGAFAALKSITPQVGQDLAESLGDSASFVKELMVENPGKASMLWLSVFNFMPAGSIGRLLVTASAEGAVLTGVDHVLHKSEATEAFASRNSSTIRAVMVGAFLGSLMYMNPIAAAIEIALFVGSNASLAKDVFTGLKDRSMAGVQKALHGMAMLYSLDSGLVANADLTVVKALQSWASKIPGYDIVLSPAASLLDGSARLLTALKTSLFQVVVGRTAFVGLQSTAVYHETRDAQAGKDTFEKGASSIGGTTDYILAGLLTVAKYMTGVYDVPTVADKSSAADAEKPEADVDTDEWFDALDGSEKLVPPQRVVRDVGSQPISNSSQIPGVINGTLMDVDSRYVPILEDVTRLTGLLGGINEDLILGVANLTAFSNAPAPDVAIMSGDFNASATQSAANVTMGVNAAASVALTSANGIFGSGGSAELSLNSSYTTMLGVLTNYLAATSGTGDVGVDAIHNATRDVLIPKLQETHQNYTQLLSETAAAVDAEIITYRESVISEYQRTLDSMAAQFPTLVRHFDDVLTAARQRIGTSVNALGASQVDLSDMITVDLAATGAGVTATLNQLAALLGPDLESVVSSLEDAQQTLDAIKIPEEYAETGYELVARHGETALLTATVGTGVYFFYTVGPSITRICRLGGRAAAERYLRDKPPGYKPGRFVHALSAYRKPHQNVFGEHPALEPHDLEPFIGDLPKGKNGCYTCLNICVKSPALAINGVKMDLLQEIQALQDLFRKVKSSIGGVV